MHRVLWEEKYGPMPDQNVARHICDNRICINLDHIIPGSCADNSADMVARGRCNTSRGENRSDAKLSAADVLLIRSSSETQATLATRYGVNQSTISRIRAYKKRLHDDISA
jgi:hypothetical protein